MKTICFFLFLVLQLSIVYGQNILNYIDGKCSHSKISFQNHLNRSELQASHSYDVIKYRLNFDMYNCFLTPYPKSYSGSVIMIYKADSIINSLRMHSSSFALQIDSVKYSGINFTHLNGLLDINLNRSHQPGETDSVKVYFRRNNVVDFSFNNVAGRVFTFAEPEGARLLYPCWDRLNDKALFEFRSKVPSNVKIGSNGILKDSILSGDSVFYLWDSNDPMETYLFTMNAQINYRAEVTYYHKISNPQDSIPVMLFYNPIIPPTIAFKQTLKSVSDFYSNIFVDYPFEKMGFANAYPEGNTNMEHQTLTLINGAWSTGGIIPHEHGHQWFGDYITCKTWADMWLNEGFASYLEALYAEHSIGVNQYYSSVAGFNSIYLYGNATMSFPIYNPSWAEHTPPYDSLFNYAIIYAKSACVIHTLRKTVGDTLFFRILKSYMNDTNFAFKSASTSDFVNKTNQVTGEDYTWFFDQWLKQPNHPKYENTMNIIDSGSAGWKLYFTINQTQTNSGFYRMPVKLKINYSNNTDSFAVINNTINNQIFTFTSSRRPIGLVFDYDMSILPKMANSVIGINNNSEVIPKTYSIQQNYPNPFNSSTLIKYSLPRESQVKILIYDVTGKLVIMPVNLVQAAGEYSFSFEGNNLASGIYFYRFEAGDFVKIKKMVMIK